MKKIIFIILAAAGLSFLLSACVKEGKTSVTMKLDDNSDREVLCLDRVYGGKVVTGSIFSDTLNATVKYNVYLPDSYERSNKQYPIVYLLHGLGGNYTNWANSGNVAKTSDDLMGNGVADEMVIIMPNAGGGGSVVYCQHHPEMFSSCYAMSGWFYLRPYEEEALEESKATYDKMTEVGIESEYTVRGGAHNWEYWRQSLRLALPFATRGFYGNR